MMIIVAYYALIMFIPYLLDVQKELTQTRHLVEMGYDYTVRPTFLEALIKEVIRYFSYFAPIANVLNFIDLMDGKYKRYSKKEIRKMLANGEIYELPEKLEMENNKGLLAVIASRKSDMQFSVANLTRESLIEQAYAIKLINKSDSLNLKETWRDLSTDRKIEFLLGELETLYYEKAQEMGVNLDEEFETIEKSSETEEEQPKKGLKNK